MGGGIRGVDEKVVHIDDKPSFYDEVPEWVVHELLKHGGGVHKSKEHDCGFKEPLVGDEGGLLLQFFSPFTLSC